MAERGWTLVPTRIYFKGSHAKVEIALARGKDVYDKRQTIRDRESKRDMERAVEKHAAERRPAMRKVDQAEQGRRERGVQARATEDAAAPVTSR